MTVAILLDTGPLGLVTHPRAEHRAEECNAWLRSMIAAEIRVYVPEIADYELRRELIRGRKEAGLERLDALGKAIGYLPLTSEAMRRAAQFWAQARDRGRPTAGDKALDGDMILCAQADLLDDAVVATDNIGHLSLFAVARAWEEIDPASLAMNGD